MASQPSKKVWAVLDVLDMLVELPSEPGAPVEFSSGNSDAGGGGGVVIDKRIGRLILKNGPAMEGLFRFLLTHVSTANISRSSLEWAAVQGSHVFKSLLRCLKEQPARFSHSESTKVGTESM